MNKKYLFAPLIMFCFELFLGINSAQAKLECYDEMLNKCKNSGSKIQCYESEDAMEKAEYGKEVFLPGRDLAWYDEQVDYFHKRDRSSNCADTRFNLCIVKEIRRRYLGYSSSNQSSNSGSSGQTNSGRANNQSSSNQSNKSGSSNNKSNQPQRDPMTEMADVLGVVTEK
jgi:hypothetical protein